MKNEQQQRRKLIKNAIGLIAGSSLLATLSTGASASKASSKTLPKTTKLGDIEAKHSLINANGIDTHIVECGEGPLVLLVHGFPESWYSWRHQLPAIANAGYRAVAIDVRGFGYSSCPRNIEDYRTLRAVGDIVSLIPALGETQATLIGHDWGANTTWSAALLRPDLFRGVAGLSVPYRSPTNANGIRPSERTKAMRKDNKRFYTDFFNTPGEAEAEIEQDIRNWLLGFFYTGSGALPVSTMELLMVGDRMIDNFVIPKTLPAWLTEEDLNYFTAQFEHSGFSGGLNRYRNADRNWEDFAVFAGRPVDIPSYYIGGTHDGVTVMGANAIKAFPETLPQMVGQTILEGTGHWTQQESPAETNKALLEFLAAIH